MNNDINKLLEVQSSAGYEQGKVGISDSLEDSESSKSTEAIALLILLILVYVFFILGAAVTGLALTGNGSGIKIGIAFIACAYLLSFPIIWVAENRSTAIVGFIISIVLIFTNLGMLFFPLVPITIVYGLVKGHKYRSMTGIRYWASSTSSTPTGRIYSSPAQGTVGTANKNPATRTKDEIILVCKGCKRSYLLPDNAIAITTTQALQSMQESGAFVMPLGASASAEDMIDGCDGVPSERRSIVRQNTVDALAEIRKGLSAGEDRTWVCKSCRKKNSYPVSMKPASGSHQSYPCP